MLLGTTERALWRYDNAFLFTNQSEVDFGIAHILVRVLIVNSSILINSQHCCEVQLLNCNCSIITA